MERWWATAADCGANAACWTSSAAMCSQVSLRWRGCDEPCACLRDRAFDDARLYECRPRRIRAYCRRQGSTEIFPTNRTADTRARPGDDRAHRQALGDARLDRKSVV